MNRLKKNTKSPPQKIQDPVVCQTIKASMYTTQVQNKIADELDKQIIKLPQQSKPFELQHSQSQLSINNVSTLKKLKDQKEKAEKILHQLDHQEKFLMANIRASKSVEKQEKKYNEIYRSNFTKQDVQRLKNLRKQYNQRKMKFQCKAKEAEEHEKRVLQNSQKQKKRQKSLQNEQKRIKIEEKLSNMRSKREERMKKYEEEKNFLKKLKQSKKLFQEVEKKLEKDIEEEENRKLKLYQERKNANQVKIHDLKNFEKHYEQLIQKYHEQAAIKGEAQQKMLNNFTISVQKSRFYNMVLEEEHKLKAIKKQKVQHAKELYQKRREYGENVKHYHTPKLRLRSQNSIGYQPQKRRQGLNMSEMKKQGLEYLSINKSMISKDRQKSLNISESTSPQTKNIRKYPDYLSETRKIRQQKGPKNLKSGISFDRELKEAQKVMKQSDISQQEKMGRMKTIAQRIDSHYPNQKFKSSTMVNKIAVKIQILQSM